MIYNSSLKSVFDRINAFADGDRIVFSDETGLIHYGVMQCTAVANVDVSSTLLHRIAKATGHPLIKESGRNTLQLDHNIKLHEGANLGSVHVKEGYYVYPFENTKARLKINGYKGPLDLPEVKEPASLKKEEKVPTWGELSEAEMDYEARCKRADWYYSFSDDQRAWRSGKAECEALQKEAMSNGGNYDLIYKYYSTR